MSWDWDGFGIGERMRKENLRTWEGERGGKEIPLSQEWIKKETFVVEMKRRGIVGEETGEERSESWFCFSGANASLHNPYLRKSLEQICLLNVCQALRHIKS
jgi:hypothetical protein